MKQINKRYYVCGNDFKEKVVPSTKQTEEITTNITIECVFCSRFVKDILRIVSISDVILNKRVIPLGHCCYKCANGVKLNDMRAFVDKDFFPCLKCGMNNFIDTPLVMQGLPTNDYGNLVDNTKVRMNELDKYRRSVKKMRDIYKKFGVIMPTFKQEMERKKRKLEGKAVSTFDYSDPFWEALAKVSKKL